MRVLKSFKAISIVLLNCLFLSAFAWWCQKNIDLHYLLTHISYLSSPGSLYLSLMSFLTLILYAARTRVFLECSKRKAFALTSIGHGGNSILPLRLGDILKFFFAKRFYQIPLSTMLASAIIEKTIDLFCIGVIIGLITLFKLGDKLLHLQSKGFSLSICFILLLLAILCIQQRGRLLSKFTRLHSIHQFVLEIRRFSSKKTILTVSPYTMLLWAVTVLGIWGYFRLSGLPLSILDGSILCVLTTLSLGVPSLMANIGLFESGVVFYLHTTHHTSNNQSLLLALGLHFFILLPQVVSLILVLLHESLKKEKMQNATL